MMLFDLAIYTPTPVATPPALDTPVSALWTFLPIGFVVTILVETPVLLLGLPQKVTIKQRLLCGLWLNACSYPIVVLVLPMLMADYSRTQYLWVAETFAPVAECLLFWLAFRGRIALNTAEWSISFLTIVVANLASFGVGEVLNFYGWFGLL